MDNINETTSGRQVCGTTTLAADIQRHHDDAQRCAGEAVEHARRAGEALLKAKAEIGHGKFQAWFDASEFTFSDRTARGYMRVARELPMLPDGKRQRVADLSLRQALEYLAEPRQTDLEKAEALQARADTVRKTLDTLRDDLGKAETPEQCIEIRDAAARLEGDALEVRATATRELGRLIGNAPHSDAGKAEEPERDPLERALDGVGIVCEEMGHGEAWHRFISGDDSDPPNSAAVVLGMRISEEYFLHGGRVLDHEINQNPKNQFGRLLRRVRTRFGEVAA